MKLDIMGKRTFNRKLLLACATSALVAGTTQANSTEIDEITVTAQKRGEQSLMEVPLSISALTGDLLEETGSETIADALGRAPGVSLIDDGTQGTRLQMRGISGLFGDTLVAFYVDDMPFNSIGTSTSTPDVSSFDLERIEVLKGPYGSLYGANAFSGVVRVITKEANLDEFEAKANLNYATIKSGGEFSQYAGALNVPIVEGKLALRAVADIQDEDGWVDAPNLASGPEEDVNETEQRAYRVKLNAAPTESLSFRGSVWMRDFETDGRAVAQDNGDFLGKADDEPIKTESITSNVVVEYETEWFTLFNALSYDDTDDERTTATALSGGFGTGNLLNTGTTTDETLANELRLNGSIGEKFQWVFGGFYRTQDRGTTSVTSVTGTLPPFFAGSSHSRRESDSWAIFGEGVYSVTDQVDVTLGGRFYEDKRSLDQTSEPEISDKYQSFSPRVNVAYFPNEDSLIYLNIAKGFRSGRLNRQGAIDDFAFIGVTIPQLTEPEVLWSYEIGGKSEFFDGRVLAELAVYYNEWTDYQFTTAATPFPSIGTDNKGEVNGIGVDFGVTLLPTDGLSIFFGGNFNDTGFDSDVTFGATTVASGQPPNYNSKWSASGAVDYARPLPNLEWDGIAHLDFQFQDNIQNFDSTGTKTVGQELMLWNARLGVENDNVGVFLFADNLFDNNPYIQPISSATTAGEELRPRPRTIGLNVRLDW